MRRVAYHIFINVALGLGHVQNALAREFRACDRLHHVPFAVLCLLLWLPFRAAFYGTFRVAFALADGLTIEQRERLRP